MLADPRREGQESTDGVVQRSLGAHVSKPAAGVLNEILGHVAFYCIDHELPPLTSIVVNARGIPGYGIPAELATIDAQREDVYAHDWYDIYPPDEEELVASFEKPR